MLVFCDVAGGFNGFSVCLQQKKDCNFEFKFLPKAWRPRHHKGSGFWHIQMTFDTKHKYQWFNEAIHLA